MSVSRRLEFIARTQLTGTAASVSFATGLSGFQKFFLVCYGIGDGSSHRQLLRINNDSGANYAYQGLSADGATVAGARTTGATSINLHEWYPVKASSVGMTVIEISKPVAGEVARVTARAGGDPAAGIAFEATAAEWTNTADVISRIDILNNTANFAAGTRILLYGSKD